MKEFFLELLHKFIHRDCHTDEEKPEFKLVPNPEGAYHLMQYSEKVRDYVFVRDVRNEEDAQEIIKNLRRLEIDIK